jgi:hypothetical protein
LEETTSTGRLLDIVFETKGIDFVIVVRGTLERDELNS